jgi:NAD(P)-dependent dehydrogenase (short-subunit alcohol dehydrogenase family)
MAGKRVVVTGASAGIGEAIARSFAELDAVRSWCQDLGGRIGQLHGLVHNAGAMPKQRTETVQGRLHDSSTRLRR